MNTENMKNTALFSISKNLDSKVRLHLSLEDVIIPDLEVLEAFGLLKRMVHKKETYYVFKDPFKMPRFNMLYASRIKGPDDPYLMEAVKRVLYLNPQPNIIMKRRIAEIIVRSFSAYHTVESEVLSTSIEKPILTYEDVDRMITLVLTSKVMDVYEPDSEDFILYSNRSKLDTGTKVAIRAEVRQQAAVRYFQQAIHTATEHLIDTESMVKLSHTRIRETDMVVASNGLASIQTIRKYMSDSTRRVFDEHNKWAPLRSNFSYGKFKDFLKLPRTSSLEEVSSKLSVSKSTAVEFKRIREHLSAMPPESLGV